MSHSDSQPNRQRYGALDIVTFGITAAKDGENQQEGDHKLHQESSADGDACLKGIRAQTVA